MNSRTTDPDKEQKENGSSWPQHIAAISACFIILNAGIGTAWPSPSVPKLIAPDNPARMTSDKASYVVIASPIGDIFGALLFVFLVDTIGRKFSLLLTGIPTIVAWIMIAIFDDFLLLCAARFLYGIAEGALFTAAPPYLGEIAEPKIRGILSSYNVINFMLGMVVCNAIGSYVSISVGAMIFAVVPATFLFTFMWMPESPYYLLMKGKTTEAQRSLQFLRRRNNVEEELKLLEIDVKRQMSEAGTFKDIFVVGSNLKALSIITALRIGQHVSGLSAFVYYTQVIFEQGGATTTPSVSAIIYTSIQLFMTFVASRLLDKFGRKPLLIASVSSASIVLIIVGTYFYLQEKTDVDLSAVSWIPLAGMLTYVIVYSIGLGIVPSVMTSELFSASIKIKGVCLTNVVYAVLLTAISKFFQVMSDNYGMFVPYFVFAGCCFLNVFLFGLIVHETKGKSLEMIQQTLKGNKLTDGKDIV